jgi:hypothetical protein
MEPKRPQLRSRHSSSPSPQLCAVRQSWHRKRRRARARGLRREEERRILRDFTMRDGVSGLLAFFSMAFALIIGGNAFLSWCVETSTLKALLVVPLYLAIISALYTGLFKILSIFLILIAYRIREIGSKVECQIEPVEDDGSFHSWSTAIPHGYSLFIICIPSNTDKSKPFRGATLLLR